MNAPPIPGAPAARDVPSFGMAFQPIIDIERQQVFAHEALVRGANGEGAAAVLGQVGRQQRFGFHEACRVRAIEVAAALGMTSKLSLNVSPNDVASRSECFQTAIRTAERVGFPVGQLMFEITEGERVDDLAGLAATFESFGRHGFSSAIDDFGAGYSSFALVAAFQPDVIKIDMCLVRNIDLKPVQQTIVRGFMDIFARLGIRVVAEGVETIGELMTLRALGVTLFQGYLVARPALAALPVVPWNDLCGQGWQASCAAG